MPVLGGPQGDEQPPAPGYWWDGTQWRPPTTTAPANQPLPDGSPAPSGGAGATDPTTGLSNGSTATPAAGTGGSGTFVDTTTGQPVKPGGLGEFDTGTRADPRYYGDQAMGEDAAESRRARDELHQELLGVQPREVPQATAPGAIPVAQTGGVTIGGPALATAADPGTAKTAAIPTLGTATQVAPVARVAATPIVAGQAAQAAPVTAATIDRGEQAEFRGGQSDLVSQLQAQARGEAPTSGEIAAGLEADRAKADQRALAATVHGYGGLAAQRTASRAIGGIDATSGQQKAMLHQKGVEDARAQLAQVLGTGREQDIGLATKEGEFRQRTSEVGAGLATDVSKFNSGLTQERSIEESRQALDAAKANQQVDLTTGLTNAQAENRFKELQAQLAAQGGQFNAEQQNEFDKLRSQLETTTSQFNAGQTNDLTKLGAELNTKVDLANTNAINTANLQTASDATKTQLANLNAQLQSRELDDKQKTDLMDAWLRENAQILGMDAAYNAVKKNGDFTWRDGVNLINGLAESGAKAYTASDKRLKKDIEPVSDDAVANLAENLRTYSYKYKDDPDGQTHVGVMAQDLEKDPLGQAFVRKGSDGMRAVDYQGLNSALLSVAIRGRKRAAT